MLKLYFTKGGIWSKMDSDLIQLLKDNDLNYDTGHVNYILNHELGSNDSEEMNNFLRYLIETIADLDKEIEYLRYHKK